MNCIKSGVDFNRLPTGTKVIVHTLNSVYALEVLPERGDCLVEGGEYFKTPHQAYFSGSTFGGCMLQIGWISGYMHMEFHLEGENPQVITTSPVRKARVIGPDWEFELDWEPKD